MKDLVTDQGVLDPYQLEEIKNPVGRGTAVGKLLTKCAFLYPDTEKVAELVSSANCCSEERDVSFIQQ